MVEYGTDIIRKIKEGNAALFVGAGMSTLAGLSDGNTLAARIKERFSKIDQNLTDIRAICQDVQDSILPLVH